MTTPKETLVTALGHRIQLGEAIGRGGHAVVHRGLREDTGELLAVKTITLRGGARAAGLRKVEAEVELLRRLRHPNIVAYVDVAHAASVSAPNTAPESFEVLMTGRLRPGRPRGNLGLLASGLGQLWTVPSGLTALAAPPASPGCRAPGS